ncbi:MAG: hypothetical protein QNK23_08720 [Crocinitomicaceae bacterium]|nr:hypothetical protein [Crocinitomicaceae bacterium]
MEKDEFTKLVVNGLERIIFEGEIGTSQSYVIYQLSPQYYVQIAGSRGDLNVHCEAVGNSFIEFSTQINGHQIQQLLKLGWSEAGDMNHTIELPVDSIESRQKLAELFYETAAIYGATTISNVEVEIG